MKLILLKAPAPPEKIAARFTRKQRTGLERLAIQHVEARKRAFKNWKDLEFKAEVQEKGNKLEMKVWVEGSKKALQLLRIYDITGAAPHTIAPRTSDVLLIIKNGTKIFVSGSVHHPGYKPKHLNEKISYDLRIKERSIIFGR